MKAARTKIVLAVWLTAHSVFAAVSKAEWPVVLGVICLLGFTALVGYQAGRGDDAWK